MVVIEVGAGFPLLLPLPAILVEILAMLPLADFGVDTVVGVCDELGVLVGVLDVLDGVENFGF